MKSDDSSYFLFFNFSVLSRYRASPDIYGIEEDDMGGLITNHDEENQNWIQLRYAYRRLSDGRICVAAFGPDIGKFNEKEKHIWYGEQLDNPEFSQNDPNFQRWIQRNMQASFHVESGPISRIKKEVKLLVSLTRQKLGVPIFNNEWNPLINYPTAENTEAYKNAHLELYRLLIDGLNDEALAAIASRLNVVLVDQKKKFNSLKEILPSDIVTSVHQPLDKCRKIRNTKHGISKEKILNSPAFDTFNTDLINISSGLNRLRVWLESLLGIGADICVKREQAMNTSFPHLIGLPKPEFKLGEIKKAEGKTISSIEFGEEESHPEVHQSEAIIFHFTDGSAMAIRVGSNASNVSAYTRKIKPIDFSTDIIISWAPSIE